MSYLLYLLYAGLIVDSLIEDILVLEEQDFNPSLVVVAVSGVGPAAGGRGPSRRCCGPAWVLPRHVQHTAAHCSGSACRRCGGFRDCIVS